MSKNTNIRIVDIARMAGVSVGTVDRILHNRGRVSLEKQEKVEKVLKEINYEPNLLARLLAIKHDFKLAVIIPSFENGDYWHSVSKGIERAVEELSKFNIQVEYLYFDQYDKKSFSLILDQVKNNEYSGAIVATLFEEYIIQLSKLLDEKEMPYVFIDSDISDLNNLAYFGADSYRSGAIAAKLMLSEIGKQANIIVAHTKGAEAEISTQIEKRESGFINYLEENGFEGKILYLEIDTGDKAQSKENLQRILCNKLVSSQVGGIIFNSRIYELVDLFDRISLKPDYDFKLIGYDNIEKNTQALKNGKVSYLIGQHSNSQGYDSVKSLSHYLLFNQNFEKINYMPIDILIKENIDHYNDYKL